jgi:sugar phosphate permease
VWPRRADVVLATIAFCFAPIGWAFYRDTPETFGLLPDGRKPARTRRTESDDEEQSAGGKQDGGGDADDDDEEEEVAIEENWTLEEARRTVVFWTTSISIGQLSLTGTAFVFHFRRAMHDANIPDEEVDRLYLMISISSIISRIGGGFLLDKTSERFVMTLGMLIQGVGMTLMGWLTPEIAMVCAFIQGLSGGIMQNVTAVAYANFFGRTHLGSIQGFAQSAGVLGSALGPLPFGLAHDLTGSYFYAWVASGMVTFVNSIFCWKYMKRPVKQQPDGVYSSPAKELKTTAGERKGLLAAAADDNDDEE